MPKYQNSIIYKLKHNEDYDDINIYIGSTTNLKNRKNGHKTCCNNENDKGYNRCVYQYIRDNGGWDEWIMIAIEEYPCYSKKELEIRERYHIDLLRSTLNKSIPTRTNEEYWRNNKDKKYKKDKRYRESHKEEIVKKKKEYYEANKEKIKEYYENNKEEIKEQKKEYYEANKEKILEKAKEYSKEYYEANKEKIKENYQNNREKILEQKKEKVICDHCGCEICKKDLKRHQKTKKCINYNK
jgi:hypothetical protein